MSRIFLVLTIAMFGIACVESGKRPDEADAPTPQADQSTRNPEDLNFFDSRIFDDDLSSSMSDEPAKITVNVPVSFSLNEIPERLDLWFYAVKESGGKVVAKPENPSRGLVSAAIDIAVAIFEQIDEKQLYEPSSEYDAILLYKEDGSISKVVFERR